MGDNAAITGVATIVGEKGARAFGSITLRDALCGVGEAWHCYPSGRPGHHRPADGSVRPLPKKIVYTLAPFGLGKKREKAESEGKIGRSRKINRV